MVHVLVIGAYGSAGIAAAGDLVEDPAIDRLTMVDDGDPGGGLCILRGCMPSKEVSRPRPTASRSTTTIDSMATRPSTSSP